MRQLRDRWIKSEIPFFRLGAFTVGVLLLTLGCYSLSESVGATFAFLGGFLFLTGLQVVTWAMGIDLEILGNVPAAPEYALSEIELRPPRNDIERLHEATRQMADRSPEWVEVTQEEASELYGIAAEKAAEAAASAREVASRQAGSVSAAIEAGKKAYVEEMRKERYGRVEGRPKYEQEGSE